MTQINPLTLAVPFFFFFGGVGVTPGDGSDDGGGCLAQGRGDSGIFWGALDCGGYLPPPLCLSFSV